jgi:ABC-2 type transport system permease protein
MNLFSLLYVRLLSLQHNVKSFHGKEIIKPVIFFLFGLVFWAGTFIIFYRVLGYFQSIESLGDFLAAKLLSMVFLVFFSLLIFSNIITSLSTFYLSQDLQLIFSLPLSLSEIFFARFIDTLVKSSWMVLVFGLPIFLAYGTIYHVSFTFYGLCLVVFTPFLMIASSAGVIITMTLIHFFPAQRTKDVLFLLSIIFLVFLFLLFRFLKPENLVDPERFASLVDYFAAMRSFSSPALPSFWATECLLPSLQSFYKGSSFFYFLMLWSTSLGLLVTGNRVATCLYFHGWSKSQESRRLRLSQSSFFNRAIDVLVWPFSTPTRVIIEKDLKVFFRDTTQWSQLLLLLSLVIVYLYNFKVLPFDKSPIPSFYLQNLFSFLNLGLAGFVLAAIAVRFVFPAVSMEGEAFWIMRTSPLSLKKFLINKFWMSLIPLVVVAEVLTVMTNYLLKVTPFMMILSSITIFFMTFGITSLGVGMGAIYPKFKHTSSAEIPTGFGGLLYMMYAMGLVGLTVVLEARPVYILFTSSLQHTNLALWFYGELSLALFLIVVINIVALVFPLHYGLKNLNSMEGLE